MSFTIKVKEETIAVSSKDKAELSALIKMSGSVGLTESRTTSLFQQKMQNDCATYLPINGNRYHCNPELRHYNKTNLKKNPVFTRSL